MAMKASSWNSKLEKKRGDLMVSIEKNKKSLLAHTDAIKKAHRRTRGAIQQMEDISRTLKSIKSRLSAYREQNRNSSKDKLRSMKNRCDEFQESQGQEVILVLRMNLYSVNKANLLAKSYDGVRLNLRFRRSAR